MKFHSYMLQYLVAMLETSKKEQKLCHKQVYREDSAACWNHWGLSVVWTAEGRFQNQEFQQLHLYCNHKDRKVKHSSNEKRRWSLWSWMVIFHSFQKHLRIPRGIIPGKEAFWLCIRLQGMSCAKLMKHNSYFYWSGGNPGVKQGILQSFLYNVLRHFQPLLGNEVLKNGFSFFEAM